MRHLAIGDIHGCFNSLSTLAAFVPFRDDDVIITLGDYVRPLLASQPSQRPPNRLAGTRRPSGSDPQAIRRRQQLLCLVRRRLIGYPAAGLGGLPSSCSLRAPRDRNGSDPHEGDGENLPFD